MSEEVDMLREMKELIAEGWDEDDLANKYETTPEKIVEICKNILKIEIAPKIDVGKIKALYKAKWTPFMISVEVKQPTEIIEKIVQTFADEEEELWG